MIWLKVGADLASWSAWLWQHRREFEPVFHDLGDFAARIFADPNGALRRVGNALVFGDEQGGGKVLAFVEQTSPRIAAIEQAVADVRVGQDILLSSLASLQTLSMVTLGLTAVTGVVLSVQLGALRKRVDRLEAQIRHLTRIIETKITADLKNGLDLYQEGEALLHHKEGDGTAKHRLENALVLCNGSRRFFHDRLGDQLAEKAVRRDVVRILFRHLAVALGGTVGCQVALEGDGHALKRLGETLPVLEAATRWLFQEGVGKAPERYLVPPLAQHAITLEFLAELFRQAQSAGAVALPQGVSASSLFEDLRPRIFTVRDGPGLLGTVLRRAPAHYLTEKAEEGVWPSRCPLGYRNVAGPDGRKTIEPDPEYAPLVVKLFEWYATGKHSLDEVAEMARKAGFVYRKSKKHVSRAALHAILRKRIYTGKFDWKGKTYQGKYEPLISEELWEKVQAILSKRFEKKHRKVKHDFAFSRLIACGHCGCALVGEIKKGQYVYYHCTGYKGKCPEPFVREEVLEECFTDTLKGLVFDDEVLALVKEALRQSHQDAKRFHEESVARLEAEHTKLQGRIDAMYVDKLDGVVDMTFFERKATEWRAEQEKLLRAIAGHQQANQTYLEEGVQLLELARRAPELFAKQEPREKRKLLDFVLSNCTWKDGKLAVTFRQPFDLLAVTNEAIQKKKAAGASSGDLCPEMLPE